MELNYNHIPVINWGISKSQLKEAETNAIEAEKDTYIVYKVNGEPIYKTYQFDNNKLVCAAVDINRLDITLGNVTLSMNNFFSTTPRKGCTPVIENKGGNGGVRVFYGKTIDDIKKFYRVEIED